MDKNTHYFPSDNVYPEMTLYTGCGPWTELEIATNSAGTIVASKLNTDPPMIASTATAAGQPLYTFTIDGITTKYPQGCIYSNQAMTYKLTLDQYVDSYPPALGAGSTTLISVDGATNQIIINTNFDGKYEVYVVAIFPSGEMRVIPHKLTFIVGCGPWTPVKLDVGSLGSHYSEYQ